MPNITTFKGLISDLDAGDTPVGAASNQVNMTTHKSGTLQPRKGIQPTTLTTGTTLGTGYNTFEKMTFCKTRYGWAIGVNGIDRGLIWNGFESSAYELGVDKPINGATIQVNAGKTLSGVAITAHTSGEYKINYAAHNLETGSKVLIGNVEGTESMPIDLNGNVFTVTVIDASNFYLNKTTHSGTHTSATGQWHYIENYKSLSGAAIASSTGATGGLIQITHTSHGLVTGDYARFKDIEGTGFIPSDLNGQTWQVTRVSANVFTLDKSVFEGTYSSATGSFTMGGKGATEGDYICAYRYKTKDSPVQYSSMSAKTTVTQQNASVFGWTGIKDTSDSRIKTIELWRTTAGQANVMYKVGEIENNSGSPGTHTFSDSLSDEEVSRRANDDVIVVVDDEGLPVADRFEPPPTYFKHVVMFQDRYFYFGTVKYNKEGCYKSAAKTITGVTGADGTNWVSEFKDRYIQVDGSNQLNRITSVNETTQVITVEDAIDSSVSTDSSSLDNYTIIAPPFTKRQIMFSHHDEPESVPEHQSVTLQSNYGDDDEIVGAMPFGASLYIYSKRNKYMFSFSTDPLADGSVTYLDDRGAFNNRCWTIYADSAYVMDDTGVYRFAGSGSENISSSIQDVFRQDGSIGSIDYAKSDNFFVKADRSSQKVYCFVCFTGDTGNYPTRALVYNIEEETWDLMRYPVEATDASTVEKSGRPRMVITSGDEKVYLVDEGTTDVVTSQTKGTATSATSNTLTDSTKSFGTNALKHAFIYIYAGTGKGQDRVISSNTSTAITVTANWTTTPDTTSKYVVGAIPWLWKTGAFGIGADGSRSMREFGIKFNPTTNEQSIDLRMYYNNDGDPQEYAVTQDLGNAVTIEEQNKTDVVFHLEKNRSPLEECNGNEYFRFDGMSTYMSHEDHKVAFELRGYSADERQDIQSVNIEGVGGE